MSEPARASHSLPPVPEHLPATAALVRYALSEGIALRQQLLETEAQSASIAGAAERIVAAMQRGGKLLLCGNGGSAADCQHIAAELTGRFGKHPRPGLPAIALTTDTSALTAIANDFSYEQIFSRQVEALGRAGDVLIAISTSGKSPNVVRACEQARAQGLFTVALCGPGGGPLGALADVCICVPGPSSERIQELHITVGHILCDVIDRAFTAGALR